MHISPQGLQVKFNDRVLILDQTTTGEQVKKRFQ